MFNKDPYALAKSSHKEYLRWRQCDISAKVMEHKGGEPKTSDFASEGRWACLLEEKLRNYEAAMRRHLDKRAASARAS